MDKLLSCPFCGESGFEANVLRSHKVCMKGFKQGTKTTRWYYIHCKVCFAQGPQTTDIEKAKTFWNIRSRQYGLPG